LPKDSDPALKPFPVRFETIDDIPSRDDVPVSLLDAWDDRAEADPQFGAAMGLKLGGWPYCIQSEIAWVEDGRRVDDVDFVFQVDSDDKVGFVVADSGIVYVGRARGDRRWHLTWQYY
jgi:hypothetical protein